MPEKRVVSRIANVYMKKSTTSWRLNMRGKAFMRDFITSLSPFTLVMSLKGRKTRMILRTLKKPISESDVSDPNPETTITKSRMFHESLR